jgi:hypothetical protein
VLNSLPYKSGYSIDQGAFGFLVYVHLMQQAPLIVGGGGGSPAHAQRVERSPQEHPILNSVLKHSFNSGSIVYG